MSDGDGVVDVEVRPLLADDIDALRRFFEAVPERDRTLFREDVVAPGVIERWLDDDRQHRLLARCGGEVVGHVAVIPGVGWSSHVGEIRLVVGLDHRGLGIGRLLAQRAVVEAIGLGLTKLVVDVVAEMQSAATMFWKLGFEAEALFKDHVKDRDGNAHDLLVLTHFVDRLWSTMSTSGVDEALGG